jgi:lipoic acid synthetase
VDCWCLGAAFPRRGVDHAAPRAALKRQQSRGGCVVEWSARCLVNRARPQGNISTARPRWLRAKAPSGVEYEEVSRLVESARLHTVCQSAGCPNIGECWRARTATFMILGNTCTRDCRFCAVEHGTPEAADQDEPRRVAEAVAYLKLKHAVVTSVTRDDLPDGGASIFAETIRLIHKNVPGCTVEVLIPDFQGDRDALGAVLDAGPEVLNHNVETVERLYPTIRPQAAYGRSIELLRRTKEVAGWRLEVGEGTRPPRAMRTKSGLMVGVGEAWEEIVQTMRDLREVGCDMLTVGQYLAPSKEHAPIERYYTPEEFDELRQVGLRMGFGYVVSGPLVRSSYHAAEAI